MTEKENLHKGHRQRMRRKFDEHGAKVFETHELLEMALYHVVPQMNTNHTARRLISRFGSLDAIFSASRDELMSVEGIGGKCADFLLALGRLTAVAKETEDVGEKSFDDYSYCGRYFLRLLEEKRDYTVALVLLDGNMCHLGTRELYSLDLGSGGVKPSPFISAAVECGACLAMIGHNHPHGPLFPSEADMQTTHLLEASLAASGIRLVESYIVSGDRFVGYQNNLSLAFSQLDDREAGGAVAKFIKSKMEAQKGNEP